MQFLKEQLQKSCTKIHLRTGPEVVLKSILELKRPAPNPVFYEQNIYTALTREASYNLQQNCLNNFILNVIVNI